VIKESAAAIIGSVVGITGSVAGITGSVARIIGSEVSITAAGSVTIASNAAFIETPKGISLDTGCKK